MLALFLLPLLGLSNTAWRSDPGRYDLYQLAAMADRIVAGTVVGLQEKTFDLVVDQDLFGRGEQKLHLQRFIGLDGTLEYIARLNGANVHRWDEYRVGQQVVLFLRGDEAMGFENEGDWPLVDGQALAPYRIHGLKWATKTLNDKKIGGTPLSLVDLGSALKGYRECFHASYQEVDGWEQLILDCAVDSAAAEAFARSSILSRHLYEETLSSSALRHPLVTSPPLDVKPAMRACADGFCPPGDRQSPESDSDSQFGSVMACLGDVNGDGWDDLAVKGDRLTLWILLLDRVGRPLGRKHVDPVELGIDGVYFGQGLAGLGDFDSDGVPDLAVGSVGREATDPGRVIVLLLNKSGGVKRVQELSGKPLDDATKGVQNFGDGVASVEDVDGNGTRDLLVNVGIGGDLIEEMTDPDPYLLQLLCLDKGGSVSRVTSLAAEDISETIWEFSTRAMASIGDLDGDGLSEVAVGFPSDGDGGLERGAVRIFFLDRNGSPRATTKLSDWSGDFESLLTDGDALGSALAVPGDLDRDGVPDLIVAGARELWILLLERDGTVKESRGFGHRSGGFVPAAEIRSLAVMRGPENTLRLAVGGLSEGEFPQEATLWMLKLGPGSVLSGP